jgi:CRISPR system Cascade subunit CasA
MNVAFDPWIPVVTLDGKPKFASLCEVLTEGQNLADLSVRPHERVSLMRLFICVAHAALDGPKDYDEWCDVPKRLPDAARKYLETWKDHFELFHPTMPWLQVAGLKLGKTTEEVWKPVSKLGFFMASGANTTLFDHEGMANDARKIQLRSTILSMISYQCFSPGGLISQVYWNGVQTSKASKDGPCVSVSMLHCLLRKGTLFQTLHANLPSYEDVQLSYADKAIGCPIWECMPNSLNDHKARGNATETYLGRLVPLSRVIRLNEDGSEMLMGNGLSYPSFIDGFPPEPTSVVVIRDNVKKERTLLSYRLGRSIWRELSAMIVRRNADGIGGPLSLRSLAESESCDLIVSALARDQATILDTTESIYHISPKFRSSESLYVYEEEVRKSEEYAKRLGWAIEDYRRTLDGGWDGRIKSAGPNKNDLLGKLHGPATTQYWTTIEKNLDLLMAHVNALGTENVVSTRKAWREMLHQAARDAYEAVCGQETPRQIKAFTEGWRKLNEQPKPKEQESKPKKSKGAKK